MSNEEDSYFWADVDHWIKEDREEADRFLGRHHVALEVKPNLFSVRRLRVDRDYAWPEDDFGGYGHEVTRAYSPDEAESAVRKADVQYQALKNDAQLELSL